MERAVHWLHDIFLALNIHIGEHIFLIELRMAAGFPKVDFRGVRTDDHFVAVFEMFLFPEIFHKVADACTFWVPENESRSDFIGNRIQVELFSKLAVVAFFCFFQPFEVDTQLLLRVPGGSVNSLQDRISFVTAPVSRRRMKKLESLNLLGGLDMRTAAEVRPVAL